VARVGKTKACLGEMTDDDMNSWLLNGPMAGTSDDNPGGWQYGSHLMEGAPPSYFAGGRTTARRGTAGRAAARAGCEIAGVGR
jgi:hypothetical protein